MALLLMTRLIGTRLARLARRRRRAAGLSHTHQLSLGCRARTSAGQLRQTTSASQPASQSRFEHTHAVRCLFSGLRAQQDRISTADNIGLLCSIALLIYIYIFVYTQRRRTCVGDSVNGTLMCKVNPSSRRAVRDGCGMAISWHI